jgi:hypothetical protein
MMHSVVPTYMLRIVPVGTHGPVQCYAAVHRRTRISKKSYNNDDRFSTAVSLLKDPRELQVPLEA